MSINIISTGSKVPSTVLTNSDMTQFVETTDQWISERTGILERRIAVNETNYELAYDAAKKALDACDINPLDIDLIVVATVTGDTIVPSTASVVQRMLKAENAIAFDIGAACTGFVYALVVAKQMMEADGLKKALVIGAERLSKIVDWTDRSTCVLLGDAAGAVVLSNEQSGGILSYFIKSVPDYAELLSCKSYESNYPMTPDSGEKIAFKMEGPNVFRFATKVMVECVETVLKKANLTTDDLDWVIPHQANKRIIDYAAVKLKIPTEKFFMNLHKYGNTSAASIPLALDEFNETVGLKKGDKIMMVGFGGGLTAGAVLIEV